MTATPVHPRLAFWGLLLVIGLFLAGGGVAYLGIQDRGLPTTPVPTAAPESLPLPQDEPEIPPGPYRERFVTACVVCHSPRLIFNQPLLTEAQWQNTVSKMVKAYGAVIPAPQDKEIVAYLVAMQQRGEP